MVALLGHRDGFLKLIESKFKSDIMVRGNEITITGEPEEVKAVATVFQELLDLLAAGKELTPHLVKHAIEVILGGEDISPAKIFSDTILIHRGKPIGPKTVGQKRYVDSIRKHTITFAIGPAGTGKTYLAMAAAVRALKNKEVGRIILTRPAVEAGEKLGYLPGTLHEKVDPYLRPLFDALYDMMEAEQFHQLMERGTIEVAPLAFMRGRTLNDSFIILDEAQNTSPEQIKMFLTRLGFGSKMVVTGDVTQIDLPQGQLSGLLLIEEILKGTGDIAFEHLTARDVVRHSLVQSIVQAYKRYDEERPAEQG
ncbi:MAG: PhoH family protein [Actinobacteria bacterium]|nr:PhoH family protein [Actinomycetota bacterium]